MVEFRSRYNLYFTSIEVDGEMIEVEFTSRREGGSYYGTSNEGLIKALKANPDVVLFRDTREVKKEEVKKEEKKDEVSVVESVTNISEAKEHLRGLGIMFQKLNTPENIMAWAQKKNVSFPNLKV